MDMNNKMISIFSVKGHKITYIEGLLALVREVALPLSQQLLLMLKITVECSRV